MVDVTATFAQSFIAAGQETPVIIRLQFGALPGVEALAFFFVYRLPRDLDLPGPVS